MRRFLASGVAAERSEVIIILFKYDLLLFSHLNQAITINTEHSQLGLWGRNHEGGR